MGLVVLIGAAVFGRTLEAPFVLDDIHSIVKNEDRRSIDVSPSNLLGTRAIPYLTLDLNYYMGELNESGYHFVSISFHLITTMVVIALMYLMARRSYRRRWWHFGWLTIDNYWLFAVTVGLIFLVHPMQTQGVNYVVQRMVLIVTLFYLSSILFYWLYRESNKKINAWLWAVLSLACAVLAMHSKEIAITLPVVILLIEYVFFSRSWSSLAKRWYKLLPWLITILIIPAYMLEVRDLFIQGEGLPPAAYDDSITDKVSIKRMLHVSAETADVSRGVYFMTQGRVLLRYIRLLIWPIGQNIDHDIPYQTSFWHPWVYGSWLIVFTILGFSIWLYKKKRVVSALGIVIFFIAISVESSFIPIKDTIFEHRVYLPMIGFIMVLMDALAWGVNKLYSSNRTKEYAKEIIVGIAIALILILAATSYVRNGVWASALTIWTDAVEKSPTKSRPLNNLGLAYADLNRMKEAEDVYKRALTSEPENVEVMINLGALLGQMNRKQEAAEVLKKSIEVKPEFTSGYVNLGNVYMLQGKYVEAEQMYRKVILGRKDDFMWASVGDALIKQDKINDAITAYEKAITVDQVKADWFNRLGALYGMQKRYDEAMTMFNRALEIDPDLSSAKGNLVQLKRDLKK
jgi:protein O-mannosyl-transferase